MEKTCRDCQQTKPASEFYPNNQKKDGLSTYCKPCFKARQAGYYKEGHPRPVMPEGMKRCSTCKELKPIDQFSSNRTTKDGKSYTCKPCSVESVRAYHRRNPEKHREYNKDWARRNPERKKDIALKVTKGVEFGTYDRMFEAQGGRCAICKNPPGAQRFHLDHCHDSGKVRGLLCSCCNTGIGQLKHDETILLNAISYLAESRSD
jgi:recombination endonuclease VII